MKSGVTQLYKNQMPLFELMSGAALVRPFVDFPGFATDALGFLLIFPLTRKLIFHLFSRKRKNDLQVKDDLIEGEYVDKDIENDKKL